ncbi:ABC transporter substrate-binding protein [Geminicoccaceae bacterium 1502E]|nr:ABC transporter substrate-binding protein [Geminicoccaceae bacterium 1502E]
MYRRHLLAGAAALMALAAGAAQAADQVSLRLNWILIGQHPPYYLGKDLGFYEQEGIDLTINEGRGSGVAVQLVANGEDDFGLADTGAVISARAKGAPVTVIMSLFETSNLGVIARADAGIGDIQDIKGKGIAVTAGDALAQVFPALLSANGIERDAVNLQFMDPAAKPLAVINGTSHALLGGIDDQTVVIEAKGVPTKVLRFADYGVNTLTVAAFTSLAMAEEKPDLVKRFVRATQKSWKAAMEDPDAAVAAAAKAKPDIDTAILKAQLMKSLPLVGGRGEEPLGYAPPELWDQTLDIMKTYRDLQTDVPTHEHYDYRFLEN